MTSQVNKKMFDLENDVMTQMHLSVTLDDVILTWFQSR